MMGLVSTAGMAFGPCLPITRRIANHNLLARQRHVKCHQELPECNKCIKSGRTCIYPEKKLQGSKVTIVGRSKDDGNVNPSSAQYKPPDIYVPGLHYSKSSSPNLNDKGSQGIYDGRPVALTPTERESSHKLAFTKSLVHQAETKEHIVKNRTPLFDERYDAPPKFPSIDSDSKFALDSWRAPNTTPAGETAERHPAAAKVTNAIRFAIRDVKNAKIISSYPRNAPPDAEWTKIDRKLVNPEALQLGKEDFEAGDGFVTVLRVLGSEEVDAYVELTRLLRGMSGRHFQIRKS
jgi:hypothetical protein